MSHDPEAPEARLVFHAARQRQAGRTIAMAMKSLAIRYEHQSDQLLEAHDIQADAYQQMCVARAEMERSGA